MRITNLTKNTTLAERAEVADTIFTRSKGLLGRESLSEKEALIIRPAKSIHTFFMKFAIDVAFLDKENKIVGLKENLVPFRLTPVFFDASYVIEFPSHTAKNTQTKIGDILKIEE